MSRECNLDEGFSRKAAIEVRPDVNALAAILANCINRADLREYGIRGRELVEQKFAWVDIAERHLAVYRWLLGRESRPVDVHI
jgi:hypothetical protein